VKGVFTGEYELTLDEKKRLMVPRNIRDQLEPSTDGEGFYLVFGAGKRLSLYTERRFEQLSGAMQTSLIPDQSFHSFELLHYGLATLVKPDSVGRITVSEKQVRRCKLEKEVTLVGVGDHLEIWNRGDWEAHVEASLTQYDTILQSARANMGAAPAMERRTAPAVIPAPPAPAPQQQT
jgi:MraZ protein